MFLITGINNALAACPIIPLQPNGLRKGATRAYGAKGARPVRATSGQRRIGQARRCRELRV